MPSVLTGDETGLVKLVELRKKQVVAKCGLQSREQHVAHLTWLPGAGDVVTTASKAVALSKQGVVTVYDTVSEKQLHRCTNAGADAVLLAAAQGKFLTVTRDGTVRSFSQSATDAAIAASFNVGAGVHAAALQRASSKLLVGGQDRELAVWDLNKAVRLWEARNVANTVLDLPVPVHITGITAVPDGPDVATSSGNLLAAVSRYRHVRLYDVRSDNRRPIRSAVDADCGEYPFTAVTAAVTAAGPILITGDTYGTMRRYDVGTMKLAGVYKGPAGAIKGLSVCDGLPYVAAASLDRCVRVFHTETRALLRRVYLKQRLTAVLFSPEPAKKGSGKESVLGAEAFPHGAPVPEDMRRAAEGEDEEDEDGNVWKELDRRAAVAAAGVKRKRSHADADEAQEEEEENDEGGSDSEGNMRRGANAAKKAKLVVRGGAGGSDDEDEGDDDEDEEDEDEDEDDEDDDEENVDDEDDEDEDGEEEDEAAAFVDSRSTQKKLLRQVEDARRAKEKAKARAAAAPKSAPAKGAGSKRR